MAQVEGFEPSNDGIKIRCLTAWLHLYNMCTPPPNPDSPRRTSNSFLRPTGHGLFYLSYCYHYGAHVINYERRNYAYLRGTMIVTLECVTGDYPASPTSDAGILNNVDHTHLYIFVINLITFHPFSYSVIRNFILSSKLTKVMRLTISLN